MAKSAPSMDKTPLVGVCTYESPTFPHAGITAVIQNMLEPLATATQRPTIVIAPYHQNLTPNKKLPKPKRIGAVPVMYKGDEISVEILRAERYYFLKPKDNRFFAGARHPYDLPEQELLRDALFYGAAVARALPLLAGHVAGSSDRLPTPWTLVCHDWECVTPALALAPQRQHQIIVVLHNVYDGSLSGQGLPPPMLLDVGINPNDCAGPVGLRAPTIMQRALLLPNVQREVLPVSDQFALDIVEDPYLADVMAPQLKPLLHGRIRGNNNGLFEKLQINKTVWDPALGGKYKKLEEWKSKSKAAFVATLGAYKFTVDQPLWGDRDAFLKGEKNGDTIWFVTGGRDDPRQRGHDVLAGAIPECLKRHPQTRFLFFVMPGDEGREGMHFLRRVAEESAGKSLVMPFRFADGYMDALRGATWAVMPSLYGPFESANEFYLRGVPGIARAAGGLVQQIIPYRAAASFSRAVQVRTERWYSASAFPTGLLYRERDGLPGTIDDWQSMNAADYKVGGTPDRLETRLQLRLFQAMVRELTVAVDDAVRLRQEMPELYYRMIVEGILYLQRSFSWDRNGQELARLIVG